MSKSVRLSEKWFRRGLWLVALVFAGFLIGLGGAVVGDLPKLENPPVLENFIDAPKAAELNAAIERERGRLQDLEDALEKAKLQLKAATADNEAARETFRNWLDTRRVTQRGSQDGELLARTQALDQVKAAERKAQTQVQEQEQAAVDVRRVEAKLQEGLRELRWEAQGKWAAEMRRLELRVFGYRLTLTLPLLGIAAWLFVKKRQGTYWPFVWGFIFFAAFAFFVELVPYLPSYGGYVRYIVGIVLTLVVGHHAILALNRYLERQKLAEQQPDAQRREELGYDAALARLAKEVCPGCERPVDLKNTEVDFCPHCGIGIFEHCGQCNIRKSAFSPFCFSCGSKRVLAMG